MEQTQSTGRRCESSPEGTGTAARCPDDGQKQYCGYCAWHWVRLSSDQRHILLSERIDLSGIKPADTHIHNDTIEHSQTVYHPPRSRILDFVATMLASGAGFAAIKYGPIIFLEVMRWMK